MTYNAKTSVLLLVCLLSISPQVTRAQEYLESGTANVAIVRNPYMASESILAEGLIDSLTALGANIGLNQTFDLRDQLIHIGILSILNKDRCRGWLCFLSPFSFGHHQMYPRADHTINLV